MFQVLKQFVLIFAIQIEIVSLMHIVLVISGSDLLINYKNKLHWRNRDWGIRQTKLKANELF